MKKLLLSVTLMFFAMMSFSQNSFAAMASYTKPHLSLSKQVTAWPTDVLVENYSRQSVTVRFITIVSDDTVRIDPYPANHYFAQLLHEKYSYQVRVLIWDYYGNLFYDKNVGSVIRITLYPVAGKGKLSEKNVVVS